MIASLSLGVILAGNPEIDSYRAHIAAADAALIEGNIARTKQWLEQAPAKHRGWEWDYLTHELDRSIATFTASDQGITKLAMSPDGAVLASTGNDTIVHLWDTKTYTEIGQLKGHTAAVFGLNFSPDGKWIITTSRDNSIVIWDVAKRTLHKKLGEHPVTPYTAAFTPDGKRVVSVGWRMHPEKKAPVGLIRVWDAETGEVLSDQDYTTHPLSSIAFDKGGKHAFIGCWEYQTAVLNLESYKIEREITPPSELGYGAVDWVDISSDDQLLLTATKDKQAKLFNQLTGEFLGAFDTGGQVTVARFFGSSVMTSASDQCLRIFERDSHKQIARLTGHGRGVTAMALTPDGNRAFSADGAGMIKVWDVSDPGSYRPEVMFPGAWSCVIDPSNRYVAIATNEKNIAIVDTKTRETIKRIGEFNSLAVDVAWSPDGKQLASGSNDGSFRVFDFETGSEIWKFQGSGQMRSSAWSKDGSYVASGQNGKCYVWDARTGKTVYVEQLGTYTVNAAFSPDNKSVFFAVGSEVHQIDLAGRKLLKKYRSQVSEAGDLAIAPGGKSLVVSSLDGRVECLDIASGKSLWVNRYDGSQWGVDYSPDGKRIACTGYDFAVHLLDTATGLETFSIRNLPVQGFDVRFSPDGQTLAYMGGEGLVWWISRD
ncbi:MAG: WD40 repeat domain-containing protein [Fimbriimonadaceae bacterium]